MPKISQITTASSPSLSDKLVGTSVGGSPSNQTNNFTLQQLKTLFEGGSPASTDLQAVLDAGNTATENIYLTGTIEAVDLDVLNDASLTNLYLAERLFDRNNSQGTSGQYLTSTSTGVQWSTLTISIPTLQQVLTAGNVSDKDITTTGDIQADAIQGANITANSNLRVVGTLSDSNNSVGNNGQVLSSTVTGIDWVDLPSYSAVSPLIYNNTLKQFSIQKATNTQNGYLSSADWITFDGKQNAGNYITALTGEATASGPGSVSITLNNMAVINKTLTGFTALSGSITAADSIITAFGKLQGEINGVVSGVVYQGVWNALTNTPALASGLGVQGHYYVVDVAGNTDLDGITDWNLGDWAIFNGGDWQKVDNTDAVVSVNGQIGIVVLNSDDISEGSNNLYYTDARSRGAISSLATGLTYTEGTGAFSLTAGYSIPTIANQTDWTTAYNDSIISAAITGTGTKTLTLNQRDGGTITANWTEPDLSLYVPYTGATGNVALGEYGLTTGFLGFDLTPTGTPTALGTMSWDPIYRTASLVTGTGATTLQIGQEEVLLVHNNTGVALTDGQVVYVTGSTGDLPSVSLADASSETTSAATLGVVTEAIANGANGFVTLSGIVNGLNTLAYNEGDILWLSETAGQFTNVKPISPAHLVLIGYVIKKAGGNGSIFVKIQNTQELAESSDVLFSSLTDKDILQYQSGTGLWENKSLNNAGIVPYIGANNPVNLGYNSLTTSNVNIIGNTPTSGSYLGFKHSTSVTTGQNGYTSMYTFGTTLIGFKSINGANNIDFTFDMSAITPNVAGGRIYTLPDASGTIALTSNLGAYLPLTGGTLTGALNGTSASFSGNVSSGGIFIGRTTNGQAFGVGNGVDTDLGIFVQTNNILFSNSGASSGYAFAVGGSTRFSIASTGAATFSSSVTAATLNATGSTDLLLNLTRSTVGTWGMNVTSGGNFFLNNRFGTNVFQISDGGNVGIGTASPLFRTDSRDSLIVSNTDPTTSFSSSTAEFYIRGAAAYDFGGTLTLYPSLWRQRLENIGVFSGSSDLVWTMSANGGAYTEYMRLRSQSLEAPAFVPTSTSGGGYNGIALSSTSGGLKFNSTGTVRQEFNSNGHAQFKTDNFYQNTEKKRTIFGNTNIAPSSSITLNFTFAASCYVSICARAGGLAFGGQFNVMTLFGIDTTNATAASSSPTSSPYMQWTVAQVSSTSWNITLTNWGSATARLAYEIEINASNTITN